MDEPNQPDAASAVAGVLLPGIHQIDVIRQDEPFEPPVDAALGTAILRELAAVGPPGVGQLRLYRSLPTLAFTGRDQRSAGLPAAINAARVCGFTPIRRPQGGRAAALHRGSVCFDLALPDPEPGTSAVRRLWALGLLLTDVLKSQGADARLGPVPNEYCPGDYSVNARGRVKLVGTAARRIRGAVLLSGVILVNDPAPVRTVVDAVYRALEIPCDVGTVGALAEEIPGITSGGVAAALEAALAEHVPLGLTELPAVALSIAQRTTDQLLLSGS